MGGVASVLSGSIVAKDLDDYDSEFSAAFLDQKLIGLQQLLFVDAAVRAAFIDFIKSGSWIDSLTNFENSVIEIDPSSHFHDVDVPASIWSKFGYSIPFENIMTNENCTVLSDTSTLHVSISHNQEEEEQQGVENAMTMSPRNAVGSEGILDSPDLVSSWTLFTSNTEIRALLFATLSPLFLTCREYKALQLQLPASVFTAASSSVINTSPKTASVTTSSSSTAATTTTTAATAVAAAVPSTVQRVKSDRLREFLLGAAATFESSELQTYLSAGGRNMNNYNWIADLQQAVEGVPISFVISKFDRDSRGSSRIIYANTPSMGSGRFKNNNNNTKTHSSKIDQNLHELYAMGCTVDQRSQLEKAVCAGQKWKIALRKSESEFILRAIKPIFDSEGRLVYMLGVEASTLLLFPFESPSSPVFSSSSEVSSSLATTTISTISTTATAAANIAAADKARSKSVELCNEFHFQRVECLLVLLPALIKTGGDAN